MTNLKKPKIELKAIEYLAGMSEETHCYSATLYVDGEKWGKVGNAGHGGPDDFHPVEGRSWDDLRALDARIAATYEPYTCEGMDGSLDYDLEMICSEIVDDWLIDRECKRFLRKPCFIAEDGSLRTFKVPKGMSLRDVMMKLKVAKPHIDFLNDLPREKAIEKMRAALL